MATDWAVMPLALRPWPALALPSASQPDSTLLMITRRKVVAAGASVWLVDEMVHAKAVVINTELALAGSANIDESSPFLNYELVTAFFRPADVHRFDC